MGFGRYSFVQPSTAPTGFRSGAFGFSSTQPIGGSTWGRTPATVGIGQAGGSGNNPPVSQPVTQPTAPIRNTGELDPNVAALVAALGGINWGIGGVATGGNIPERELSLIRPTEFTG